MVSSRQFVIRMKFKHRMVLFGVAAVLIYTAGYFLLMIRDFPAFLDGKVRFYSAYRWARPAGRATGETDTGSGEPSLWNYVFLPADFVYYALCPDCFLVRARKDSKFSKFFD